MTAASGSGPLAGTRVLEHAVGRAGERPVPPLNLVGDDGGGALSLALGVLAARIEAARTRPPAAEAALARWRSRRQESPDEPHPGENAP